MGSQYVNFIPEDMFLFSKLSAGSSGGQHALGTFLNLCIIETLVVKYKHDY